MLTRLDDRNSILGRSRDFFFLSTTQTGSEIQWEAETCILGAERSGHETDHSPQPSALVNSATPPLQHKRLYDGMLRHRGEITLIIQQTTK